MLIVNFSEFAVSDLTLRDGEKATHKAHNLEIGGSNPYPAILQRNRVAPEKQKPYCLSVVFINKAIIRKAGK